MSLNIVDESFHGAHSKTLQMEIIDSLVSIQ
jgi:hypothetical protein